MIVNDNLYNIAAGPPPAKFSTTKKVAREREYLPRHANPKAKGASDDDGRHRPWKLTARPESDGDVLPGSSPSRRPWQKGEGQEGKRKGGRGGGREASTEPRPWRGLLASK